MSTSLIARSAVLPFLLCFVGAFGLALILTHRVRGWASRRGLVDLPDGVRRMHVTPTPRVGGIAIFIAVAAVFAIAYLVPAIPFVIPNEKQTPVLALMAGGAAVFALGLWDDFKPLSPNLKFAVESVIATLVFIGGIRIDSFGVLGQHTADLPILLSYALTLFWIVGITNAFNLIDGSDGVAAGAALFASSSLAVVSLLNGNTLGALIALVLAGATLGFLFFNFPPASIFLGDSGSLFLGFTLAALGVISMQKGPTAVAVAIPIVSFGLPIMDTLLTMVRRFLRREPIFAADRGHIHHRLRDLGHSPKDVALLLYAICGGFALLSLGLVGPSGAASAIILTVAGLVVGFVVQRLNIPEILEVQRALSRGLLQRTVIAHNLRIREAGRLLEVANTPDMVLHALEFAFTRGDFARAELWLDRGAKTGLSCAWDWSPNPNSRLDGLWEIRLPLHDDGGKIVGRLSLWCGNDGEYMLTDLQLIAKLLHPELEKSLLRFENGIPPVAVVNAPASMNGTTRPRLLSVERPKL